MTTETLANLYDCFDSISALAASLSDADWETQSLCPDWTVHDVIAHLGGVESMLVGWWPQGEEPAPLDQAQSFISSAGTWSHEELLARFTDVLAARRAELDKLAPEDFDAVSWTPVGVQTYGRFMAVREFDFWVHEQDIRQVIDRPGHESGPPAEMALDEVRGSFGYIVGKRAAIPDGTSVKIRLTGPVRSELAAVVEGRARVVDHLAEPDVEVAMDSTTFMLLACGRLDPDEPIGAGKVHFVKGAELGDQLARNLRFTM